MAGAEAADSHEVGAGGFAPAARLIGAFVVENPAAVGVVAAFEVRGVLGGEEGGEGMGCFAEYVVPVVAE